MSSYFGGPLTIPQSTALQLENSLGNLVSIQASSSSFTNYTLTLPLNDGDSGQYLQTNGSGVLSWQTVSGGGGDASSIEASNITLGTSNVLVSTNSGEVRINAPSGESVQLQINNSNIAAITGTGVEITGALTPSTADGGALGSSTLYWSDIYLADEAVIYLGDDQEVTLTHVHNTGLLLNSDRQLQFRDSTEYINSSTNGVLDLVAGTSVNVAATLNVTGTVTATVAITPDTADGATLGTTSLEWSDLYMADGANIYLGADQDVILTHEPDAGLTLQGSSKLHFNDTTANISSASSGNLSVNATTEVEIVTSTLDIQSDDTTVSGNIDVSGTFQLGVDTFDYDGNKYDITGGSNVGSVKYIAISGDGQTAQYWCNAAPKGTGSIMHIFYMDAGDGTSSANIDFSASNLYTGGGTVNYLYFNQTGQSAHLIYIADAVNDKNGWRIINVGGQVF